MKYLTALIKKSRFLIGNLLDRCPPLRTAANWALYVNFLFWKLKVQAKDYGKEFDASKVCWINPEVIKYISLKEFNIYQDEKAFARVILGNWDMLEKKIEDSNEYQVLKRKFIQREKIENTASNKLSDVSQSELKYACDLTSNTKDEITANVGREGDILLNSGINTLSAAKLLNVQRVPIRIVVRYPQWQKFRKELYALSLEKSPSKRLYQPLTHPDLCDIAAEHRCEDRFDIIKENLSVRSGRLLDIGANLGYFCHKFEEIGFECYAVENDLQRIYFLKKLKRAENRKFRIISQSILEWEGVRKLEFDVVLALNIFHHFLKKKTAYLGLIKMLKTLKMREMFFEPHIFNEPQMKNTYKNYSEKEFVEFILQNSQFKSAEPIGIAQDGRPLYRLH